MAYKTFTEQALHYFIRDHEHIPSAPVESPADWLGVDMSKYQDQWLMQLTKADIDELDQALEALLAKSVPMAEVTASHFPLPSLGEKIRHWRTHITQGRGFVVVRGLPVTQWSREKVSYAWWGLGHHLGTPGAQNADNELLGHVYDRGEEADHPMVRRYRTTGDIGFHCDAADVVGLLCLQPAKVGGQSRVVSSVAIFNELLRRSPHLVPRLFEPFNLDRRDEHGPDEVGYIGIPPCCYNAKHGLQTTWHSEYYRSVERYGKALIDETAREVLDAYDDISLEPDFPLDMWLEPGDMQFLSNHTILHARTAYEDWPEPERKRHLLRLWLSVE